MNFFINGIIFALLTTVGAMNIKKITADKLLAISAVVLLIITVSGCGTMRSETKVITENQRTTFTFPKALLEPCTTSAPPSKEIYLSSDFRGKEELLMGYATRLLGDLKTCNKQIEKIKTIHDNTKLIVEGNPTP